jgi:hypothetical protein
MSYSGYLVFYASSLFLVKGTLKKDFPELKVQKILNENLPCNLYKHFFILFNIHSNFEWFDLLLLVDRLW